MQQRRGKERSGEGARQGEATLICRQLISKRQSKARTRLMRSIRRIREAKAPSAAEQVSLSDCKEKECVTRERGGVTGVTLVPPAVLITPIVRYSSDMLVSCTLPVCALCPDSKQGA